MRQWYELRVVEELAATVFEHTEGVRLGASVRKVVLRDDDPRIPQVAALQAKSIAQGKMFFAGWRIHRKYSQAELASAELLHLTVSSAFEPPGADFGTTYDETSACPGCGRVRPGRRR